MNRFNIQLNQKKLGTIGLFLIEFVKLINQTIDNLKIISRDHGKKISTKIQQKFEEKIQILILYQKLQHFKKFYYVDLL